MKVSTMQKNQLEISTKEGLYFQSYKSLIAFKSKSGKVTLSDHWNYSRTTMKYLGQFLGENSKEIRKKVENGTYEITLDRNGEI